MIRKWTKRFLFVAASIAFLAWGIGERVFPHFGRAYPTRLIMLDFRNGGFILRWIENRHARIPTPNEWSHWEWSLKGYASLIWHSGNSGYRMTTVEAKLLPLCAMLACYPCLSFCRDIIRRHRRRKSNQCLRCGYNLTGLTESRCPECGEET